MRYLDLGPIDKIELGFQKTTFDWDFSDWVASGVSDLKEGQPRKREGYPSRSVQSVFGRLMAHMAFPEDDEQRLAVLATFRLAFSSALDQIFDDPSIQKMIVEKFGNEAGMDVLGFIEGLTRNKDRADIGSFPIPFPTTERQIGFDGEGYSKGLHESRCAGLILYFYRCLSTHDGEFGTGASLNRVVFLLEERLGFNRSEIMRHWRLGKSVSHLAAAWYEMSAIADSLFGYDRSAWIGRFGPFADFGPSMQFFGSFLTLAREYQEFGLRYKPSGSQKPILDSERIWRIPESELLKTRHSNSQGTPGRLDDESLKILENYRAPKNLGAD